jgi:hypothetical protein
VTTDFQTLQIKEREPIAEKAFALETLRKLDNSFYASDPLECSSKSSPGEDDPSPGKCSESQGRRLQSAMEETQPSVFVSNMNGFEQNSEDIPESMRKLLDLEAETEQNLENLEYLAIFYRWEMLFMNCAALFTTVSLVVVFLFSCFVLHCKSSRLAASLSIVTTTALFTAA